MARAARATLISTQSGDREIELLDAAAIAFMRQGFAATSLDRVSDELKSTKGLIYYYYRSKSDLFFAVHRRAMELTDAAIRPPFEAAGTAGERLKRMAQAHTLLIMDYLPYLRVVAQGLELHLLERTRESERTELSQISVLRRANEALYVRVIEQGVASGEFRSVNPRLMSKPLLGALNWTSRWYQPRPGESQVARKRIADEIAEFVLRGLFAV
jgi:AcrR family transcriptional regulator